MLTPLELHDIYKQSKNKQKTKFKPFKTPHAKLNQLLKLGLKHNELKTQQFQDSQQSRLGFLPLLPATQPHNQMVTISQPRKPQTNRQATTFQLGQSNVKTPTMQKNKFIEKELIYRDINNNNHSNELKTIIHAKSINTQQSSPMNQQPNLKFYDENQQLIDKASQLIQSNHIINIIERKEHSLSNQEHQEEIIKLSIYLKEKEDRFFLTKPSNDYKKFDKNVLIQNKLYDEKSFKTEGVEIKGQSFKPCTLKLDTSILSIFKKKKQSVQVKPQYSCYCKSYAENRKVRMATERLYKHYTKRVLLAEQTLTAERQRYPMLIIVLEGIVGYIREQKSFMIRFGIVEGLIMLSQCFRIVIVSQMKQKRIKSICQYLSNCKESLVFDGVYKVQKTYNHPGYINYSQLLLDFGFRNSFARISDHILILQPIINEDDPNQLLGTFECEEHFYLLNHSPVHLRILDLALQPLSFTPILTTILSLFGLSDLPPDPIPRLLRLLQTSDYSFKRNFKHLPQSVHANYTLQTLITDPNSHLQQRQLLDLNSKLLQLHSITSNKTRVLSTQMSKNSKSEALKAAYNEMMQQNMGIRKKIEEYRKGVKEKIGESGCSRGWEWERERDRIVKSKKEIKRRIVRIGGGAEGRPVEIMIWAEEKKKTRILEQLSVRQKPVMFSTGINPVNKDGTTNDPNSFINDFFKQNHRTLKPS